MTHEVEIEIKYAGYIAQQDRADARRKDAWDECRVPEAFPFHSIRGLSREVLEKLEKHRPLTVGQARQVPGITPAAVSLLLIHLRRWRESPEGASRRQNPSCG